MNLMEAHGPMYNLLEYDNDLHSVPYQYTNLKNNITNEMYRDLYPASIDYLDKKVEEWIAEIQPQTEHPTTFIVTSDHGQNLGFAEDRELMGHNASLIESILHVPLEIINPPNEFEPDTNQMLSLLELPEIIEEVSNNRKFSPTDSPVVAEVIGYPDVFNKTWNAS